VREQAEEFLAAGIAAVRGKAKKPLHAGQDTLIDAIAPNVLRVEIAAARAMGIAREGSRDRPGVKALIASVAAPWAQPQQRAYEIGNAASVRAVAIRAPALRTDHPEVFSG